MPKFPPRGYTEQQFPLPHRFSSSFGLGATSATKGGTSIPILRNSWESVNIEAVEVNPRHGNFAEETGMSCFTGSIVPKINFTMSCFIPEAAIATGVRHINFKYMPIYFAFADSYDAFDEKTNVDVEAILEMSHDTTQADATPIYAAKTFSPGNLPLNTITQTEVYGDWGLTTDVTYEGIALDEDLMFKAIQYYTNGSKLKMAMGQIRTAQVRQDRPFFFKSNNFTYPTVKRMNPFTYCGMHVWVPQANSTGQSLLDSEITDIEHLHFNYRCSFDEWNPNFDQTVL